MPIITFFRDVFALTKGPYYRYVGRHTESFCHNAQKMSRSESERRILMIAAISADEWVAALAGLDHRRELGPFGRRSWTQDAARGKKMKKRQMTGALRSYLSGLLVIMGSCKEEMLRQSGLNEEEWIQRWCRVFGYGKEDMEQFDQVMMPSYQEQGLPGLARTVGSEIWRIWNLPEDELTDQEALYLRDVLLADCEAMWKVLRRADAS